MCETWRPNERDFILGAKAALSHTGHEISDRELLLDIYKKVQRLEHENEVIATFLLDYHRG